MTNARSIAVKSESPTSSTSTPVPISFAYENDGTRYPILRPTLTRRNLLSRRGTKLCTFYTNERIGFIKGVPGMEFVTATAVWMCHCLALSCAICATCLPRPWSKAPNYLLSRDIAASTPQQDITSHGRRASKHRHLDEPSGSTGAGTPRPRRSRGSVPTISRPTCRDGRPIGPARPDERGRFQIRNRPPAPASRRAPTKLRGFESRMRHQSRCRGRPFGPASIIVDQWASKSSALLRPDWLLGRRDRGT